MKTDCLPSEKTYRETIEGLRTSLINRRVTKSRGRITATHIIRPVCPTCGQLPPMENRGNNRVVKERIIDAISSMANRLAQEKG